MSRHVSVADVDRSVAFYREVLGFDTRAVRPGDGVPAVVEVVSGPARIQLSAEDSAYDSTGERRPRGAAILFFQTDDRRQTNDLTTTGGANLPVHHLREIGCTCTATGGDFAAAA